MRGKGSTRIDVILANAKVAFSIAAFQLRWDLVKEAHVPPQIDMNVAVLNEDEVVLKIVGLVECSIDIEDIKADTGKIYESIEEDYGQTLQDQIARKDLNGARITWNRLAELCAMMVQGEDKEEACSKV